MTTNLVTRNHTHELSHSCQESAVELLGPLFRVSQDWDGVTVEALVCLRLGSSSRLTGCWQNSLPCGASSEAPTSLLVINLGHSQGWSPLHNTVLAGPLLHISPSSFKGSPDLARSTQVNLLVIQSKLFRDLIYIYKIPFALREA